MLSDRSVAIHAEHVTHSWLRGLEVLVVFAALVPIFLGLDALGVMAWQKAALPYPFVTEIGVLIAVPLAVTSLARRGLADEGFAIDRRCAPRSLAVPVAAFAWLSTLPFLVLPPLGASYTTPLGSVVLAVGNLLCGVGMLATLRNAPGIAPVRLRDRDAVLRIAAVLGLGVIGVVLTTHAIPLVARLFGNVLLTAFCEELFFRGYVQGGLDAAFGRRWQHWGVRFGPGLFIAAALFGVFHLVPSIALGSTIPWAWAGWTAVFGVFAGALRARTSSFVLPWVMHGTLLAIRAFGGG